MKLGEFRKQTANLPDDTEMAVSKGFWQTTDVEVEVSDYICDITNRYVTADQGRYPATRAEKPTVVLNPQFVGRAGG